MRMRLPARVATKVNEHLLSGLSRRVVDAVDARTVTGVRKGTVVGVSTSLHAREEKKSILFEWRR